MFTIRHYGNVAKARTASGAIRAARKLIRTYGQGNRNPAIDADSMTEAKELSNMQRVAQTDYPICCNGEAIQ